MGLTLVLQSMLVYILRNVMQWVDLFHEFQVDTYYAFFPLYSKVVALVTNS